MAMTWKARFGAVLVAAAATFGWGSASAQDYTFGWNPRSGDVWVDTWLGDMNRYGARYRDPFVDEMVRYYGAPRDLVNELLTQRRWAPGDVYFACAIASVLGRPCRYVADMWERDHAQGWGVVAKNLGIKPGSAEFHRLKKGFVPSYDRWGRSISIDADLARDFPGRPRDPGKSKGAASSKAHADNGKPSASKGSNGHGGSKPKGNAEAKGAQGKGNAQPKGQGKGKG
ncbi:hypothetical protein [Lysobacter auxotrophicus]|uniref:Pentapeptide repeat-containing protein n=1 Tax=Lysobacter auxotrophicus TaxID=2992573 RepID=A0ABN6UGG1_9GAMM|nr:hypothetical protein [Lysobacter auxotrophicus]BDU15376.1 pentapeptide repeat-containing protein [Lysobacter auxotrophicus]